MLEKNPTLVWYSSRIGGGKKLSAEEEKRLALEAREGSSEALHELVEDKLAFVIKVVREFWYTGAPIEDLLSEANVGLMEAARHFDPDKGNRFVTYAIWWIRKAIFTGLQKHGRLVKVSNYHQRKIREIRDAERRLERKLGRAPTGDEIHAEIPGGRKKVDRLLGFEHVELSLDERVRGADDLRLADRLADPGSTSQERDLIRREEHALLLDAFNELSVKERQVIALRFGLRDDTALTLAEVGKRMGLSRERVRQIEHQGKARLQRSLVRQYAGKRVYPGSGRTIGLN